MTTRSKALVAVLVIALLVTASLSILLYSSNSQLQKDKDAATMRLQMSAILMEGQMAVNQEIEKIGDSTHDLSKSLATYGLNGTSARNAMNAELDGNQYIIDILTYDTDGRIQAVVPEQYSDIEGMQFTDAYTIKMLEDRMPIMSDTFIAAEGMRASGYAFPIFDGDGTFIGAVSVLYDVAALMGDVLPDLSDGTEFTWFSMQLDGVLVYDVDGSQIGRNTFTDPAFADFTELVDLGRRSVNETSGHGTYSFVLELETQQVVSKECFWTTVGAETVQWRLFIVNAL